MLGLVRRPTLERVSAFAPLVRQASRQSLSVSLAQLINAAPDTPFPSVNFNALERKFGESGLVYAVVIRKARDLARAPLTVKRTIVQDGKEAEEPVEWEHPFSALLRKVTDYGATQEWLVQITSAYLDLTGNAFWLILRDRKNLPTELYPVNPLAVQIYPRHYEVWHYGERMVFRRWTADQQGDLLHFRLPNPKSDAGSALPSEWGIGPLEAAWTLVVTDQDAVKWNRNLVKNDGRPSGILTSEKEDVSEAEARAAADRYASTFGGPTGAGKVLVLGKGLKYERIGMTPKEADYGETRNDLRREILTVFDVNPAVMGFETGDVGRRDEQLRNYWQSAIVSRSRSLILPTLNEFLAPEFGPDIFVGQDFSDVRELQENEQERATLARTYFDMGYSRARINERFGLGFDLQPGDEVEYLPISYAPASALVPPEETPEETPEDAVSAAAEKIASMVTPPSEWGNVEHLEALAREVAEEQRKRGLVPRTRTRKDVTRDEAGLIVSVTETTEPVEDDD